MWSVQKMLDIYGTSSKEYTEIAKTFFARVDVPKWIN